MFTVTARVHRTSSGLAGLFVATDSFGSTHERSIEILEPNISEMSNENINILLGLGGTELASSILGIKSPGFHGGNITWSDGSTSLGAISVHQFDFDSFTPLELILRDMQQCLDASATALADEHEKNTREAILDIAHLADKARNIVLGW